MALQSTVGEVVAWSFPSSIGVAAASTALGAIAAAGVADGARSARFRRALPLLLCWGIPPLALGYGLSPLVFKFTGDTVSLEALYLIIVTCRLAALAGLAFLFLPKAVPPEALHAFNMASMDDGRGGLASLARRIRFLIISGGGTRVASVFFLVFLVAFGDFELASMLNVQRWTTAAFDACSQGRSAAEVAGAYAIPCLAQLLVATAFLALLPRGGGESPFTLDESGNVGKGPSRNLRRVSLLAAWLIPAVAAGFPVFVICRGAFKGLSGVLRSPWMLSETFSSFLFATAAVTSAWGVAKAVSILKRRRLAATAATLPGLLGAFPLSLAILSLFQSPLFLPLRDKPAPLFIALTLLSVPYALAAVLLGEAFADGESLHSARIAENLDGKKRLALRWTLKTQATAVMMAIVFAYAYFELTASAILAPSATPTLSTRLFNLAHYGESERLSATILLVSILPAALLALAAAPALAARRRGKRASK